MMMPGFNSFYLVVLVLFTNAFNAFLKYAVMKPLYKWTGSNELFLLGSGSRPAGATGCHFTLDGKKATSFGMPSGHSQIAWTIGTYLICRLINKQLMTIHNENENENTGGITANILNNIWMAISIVVILVVASYISYSRVYIEGCHTIQQVIIGGIVGVVLGFLAFYFENDIKRMMRF